MPQFKKKPQQSAESKHSPRKAQPEYRGYVQIPLPPGTTREILEQIKDDQVLDLCAYYTAAGYKISAELDDKADIRVTAYGVKTEAGKDDGIGVSATGIDYHLAIRALLVKLNSATEGLWKFYIPPASAERPEFS